MKDWLKRVIRKVGYEGTVLLTSVIVSTEIFLLVIFSSSSVYLPPGILISAIVFGSFILVLEAARGSLVCWAHSDDNPTSPPNQKLLMQNALQEIEDYLSGKSLIDEIEKLRNRFVTHLHFLSSQLIPSLRAT